MATTTQILANYAAIDYTPPYALAGQPIATLPAAPDPILVALYQPLTNDVVISAIEGETYTLVTVNAVIREYQGAFGTVPDQAGVAFWVHAIDDGTASLATLSVAFASSPQFSSLYNGATATTPANPQLVTAFYQNVLGRAPDAAGLAFWVNSGLNAAQLLAAFTQSAEDINLLAPHIVEFQNLEAAGNPPVPPTSLLTLSTAFTLTPNIDIFNTSATGQVFNALPFVQTSGLANNTLNTGDTLTDSANDGTLFYTASPNGVAANPPFALGVTLNGIATANISNQAIGIVAGFQGVVTGLTTVGDTGSVFGVKLGGLGQGLNTALTNVNISGYGGPNANGIPVFNGIIATKAGSATNTINIGLTGPLGATTKAGADTLQFTNDGGPGTAANPNLSYGTWAITTANNVDLQLQQGGVGAATKLSLSGAGNIAVGQDAIGNWQNVKDINASGETGTVIVTGGTAGNPTNAHGTVGAASANPNWLFGSTAGLLNDTGTAFNLTTYELGSGTNILDVSSATAAQIAALVTTPNTLASLTNTIIVQDSVATTTSATTFAGIKGFQTLGIGGPTLAQGAAGTIDMTKLPGTISTIDYFTKAAGSVTINNQTAALTVNLENNTTAAQNLTVGLVGPAAGLADSLTVSVGNPLQLVGDGFGDITAFGDEVFTIASVGGGAAALNDGGGIFLVPTPGGTENVKITGDTNLLLAVDHSINGAISDGTGTVAASGVLLVNNLTVTDTNSGATAFGQGLAGSLLLFATDAGANLGIHAPLIAYSNNAVTIDASGSGGLISPWDDANFVPGGTVALSTGDVIKGATTPIGFQTGGGGSLVLGDVLGGSIGNDTITSNSTTLPDYIVTGLGSDTINLAAGHTGVDHVAFYAGAGNVNGAGPSYAVGSVATAISEAVVGGGLLEFVNPGVWGIAAGGSSQNINLLFTNGTGTSADNSTVNGFNPGGDVIDFSTGAWGTGALVNGLTANSGAALIHVAGGLSSPTGTAVNAVQVAPGGAINGTAAAPNDLIILSQGSFLNAAAVAGALDSTGYNITHSAAAALTNYDFLLAYQGIDGNTHIADLHILGAAGSTHTGPGAGADANVNVSDIATLVGVNLTAFAANAGQVHIVT